MCTDFILAIFYFFFLTIFNFFLYFNFRALVMTISSLKKIKKLIRFSKIEERDISCFFYFFSTKVSEQKNILQRLYIFFDKLSVFSFLKRLNFSKQSKTKNRYFDLIWKQYVSFF